MKKHTCTISPRFHFTLIELLVSKTCQICVSLLFLQKYLSNFATNWSKIIPLFLKEKGGAGERENFFSRPLGGLRKNSPFRLRFTTP